MRIAEEQARGGSAMRKDGITSAPRRAEPLEAFNSKVELRSDLISFAQDSRSPVKTGHGKAEDRQVLPA